MTWACSSLRWGLCIEMNFDGIDKEAVNYNDWGDMLKTSLLQLFFHLSMSEIYKQNKIVNSLYNCFPLEVESLNTFWMAYIKS